MSDSRSVHERRQFLLSALSSGLFVGGLGWQDKAMAGWFGSRPKPLPEGQSIHQLEGRVLVNGRPANKSTRISAQDQVEVGPGGKLLFAVGSNAYLMRERSILELSGRDLFVSAMRLVNGAVLGVFGKRESALTLTTQTATIGIRGTAVYTRSQTDMTYACTCYGHTELQALAAPQAREEIRSKYHDAPRWILGPGSKGPAIIPAPMMDHEDLELIILEALVGREVPFQAPPAPIGGPRRGY